MIQKISGSRLALPAILLLGFALRITAVNFGLPHLYHADEPIVVNHALAYGTWDFNPHFFKIPPLVSYLLLICYGVYFVLGRVLGIFKSLQDFEYLFYGDPTSFYLIARFVFGVILGTFTIYLLYRLVLKFFDRPRALLSALFLSVCFLHVRDSHYIYVDIPLVLVLVGSFFVLLKILKGDASTGAGIQIGMLIGLATAVKYNGASLIVPYAAVCMFHPKAWRGVPLAALTAVVTFVALNPYAVMDYSFFLREIIQQSKSNTGVSWAHHFTYSLNGSVGPVILGLGCFAMIHLFSRFNPKKGIFALFCLAYYLILMRAGQPYDRYVLPILPFLIFLAADLILEFKTTLNKHLKPVYAGGVTAILILAGISVPLTKCILWNKIMLRPDVRTLAKEWLERNIPEGSRIAVDRQFHAPRLEFTQAQLNEKKTGLAGHQRRRIEGLLARSYHPTYHLVFLVHDTASQRFLFAQPVALRDPAAFRDGGFDYVVSPLTDSLAVDPFLEELRGKADLLIRITPYEDSAAEEGFDAQPLTAGPFLWRDLWARERNGYPVVVYKLR